MTLTPYLFFDGQCVEAMNFYKSVFGGELDLLTYGKQLGDQVPKEIHERILHAHLRNGTFTMLASDTNPAMGKLEKNTDAINIALGCDSAEQLDEIFAKLSVGGKPEMPPHDAFWGGRFAMLKDKYEMSWMLNFEKSSGT